MKNISFFIPYTLSNIFFLYAIITQNTFFFEKLGIFLIVWILIYWKINKEYPFQHKDYYNEQWLYFFIWNIVMFATIIITLPNIYVYVKEYSTLVWIPIFFVENLFIFIHYIVSEIIILSINHFIITHFKKSIS